MKLSKCTSNQPANKLSSLLSRLMVLTGSFLIGITLAFHLMASILPEKIEIIETVVEDNYQDNLPSSISIDEIAQDLELVHLAYSNGLWELSDTNPSYLIQSARPGQNGNIIIYGHNRAGIFQNLHQVEVNDIIKINTPLGKFEYKISEVAVVNPTQTEYLKQTDTETLTVYTCYGFLDTKRFVVRAVRSENLKLTAHSI